MSDPQHWLTLALASGLGARRIATLLETLGSAESIIGSSDAVLAKQGVTASACREIRDPDPEKLGRSLDWLQEDGHDLISLEDSAYPDLLKKIADPPPVLFVSGSSECLGLPQLAMVGSRNPTPAGLDTARMFARHLSASGLTITSGLALGIDSASHRGALDAGGVTIGVLGCGPDRIYPAGQDSLADAIREKGALISEFPPGTPPSKQNFPQRNRVVSGLSVGTLVVEAARASGSLITARHAVEQGREVFAVPGSIHNPQSRGCHRLIRQGAKLVESADDIFEELGAMFGSLSETERTRASTTDSAPPKNDDQGYRQLLNALGEEALSIDKLAELSGLTAREVSSMLLILELQGLVQAAPGGRYCKATARR
jgi:DNA processing protein